MSSKIRPALPTEAELLSALGVRSKAHWGYSAPQMKIFTAELTLTPSRVEATDVHLLESPERILGYYTLVPHSDSSVELEHLFVEPSHLRQGLGSRLFLHATKRAASRGYTRMVIQSDPFAEGFYKAQGAELVMQLPTSIPGRTLPLMDLRLR